MNNLNIKWIKYNNVLIPDVPPHINIYLSYEEAKKLLKVHNVYFIRFTNDFDSTIPYPFWYVIKDKKEDESLKSYPSSIRSEIRRGLKNTNVDLLHRKDIKNYGEELYIVYSNSFKRYKNLYIKPLSKKDFLDSINQIEPNNNYDIWVVKNKIDGKIIAYGIVKIQQGDGYKVANYSVIKLHPEFLKLYPSYSLIFEMNRYYLNENSFNYVNDGARSIGHDTNIQDWLIKKFQFRKAYCKLNVYYRKDIKILTNILNFPFFKFLIKKNPIDFTIINKLKLLITHSEIERNCELLYRNYKNE